MVADQRFFDSLRDNAVAGAAYRRHHNETLVRYLTPASGFDRFRRGASRDALTDLAHVKAAREA